MAGSKYQLVNHINFPLNNTTFTLSFTVIKQKTSTKKLRICSFTEKFIFVISNISISPDDSKNYRYYGDAFEGLQFHYCFYNRGILAFHQYQKFDSHDGIHFEIKANIAVKIRSEILLEEYPHATFQVLVTDSNNNVLVKDDPIQVASHKRLERLYKTMSEEEKKELTNPCQCFKNEYNPIIYQTDRTSSPVNLSSPSFTDVSVNSFTESDYSSENQEEMQDDSQQNYSGVTTPSLYTLNQIDTPTDSYVDILNEPFAPTTSWETNYRNLLYVIDTGNPVSTTDFMCFIIQPLCTEMKISREDEVIKAMTKLVERPFGYIDKAKLHALYYHFGGNYNDILITLFELVCIGITCYVGPEDSNTTYDRAKELQIKAPGTFYIRNSENHLRSFVFVVAVDNQLAGQVKQNYYLESYNDDVFELKAKYDKERRQYNVDEQWFSTLIDIRNYYKVLLKKPFSRYMHTRK